MTSPGPAVDRLAAGTSPAGVARRAIADVNELDGTKDPAAMNIVVLAADGRYASATNRPGREFAVMTSEMREPRVDKRTAVRPS